MTMTDKPVWAGRRLFFEDIDAYEGAGTGQGVYPDHPRTRVEDPADANLVSSLADDGSPWIHRPVIDIDHPCELVATDSGTWRLVVRASTRQEGYVVLLGAIRACEIGVTPYPYWEAGTGFPIFELTVPCKWIPSTTPGHGHLYIDKAIPWYQYCDLLRAMVECGIVEEGYYQAALRRGATFVRMPGVRKPARAPERCRLEHAVVVQAPDNPF